MNKDLVLALYTVRNDFFADFRATLRAVREIGYAGVEFAGLASWKAEEVRAQCDELGLRGVSAHVPLQRLRDELSVVMRESRVLGLDYVVFPWLPPEQRNAEFYRSLVPTLRTVGEACRDSGLGFCYHNHDFEFEPVFGDRSALEFLAAEVGPELMRFELDVYWSDFAGHEPVRTLESLAGRVPLLHLKDMTRDESRRFAEVGHGRLDMPAIVAAGEGIGVEWCIVEQDVCERPALESAAMSFRYLQGLGFGG